LIIQWEEGLTMLKEKKIYGKLIFLSLLFLNSCAQHGVPRNKGGYYYHHIYFGTHLTRHYKKGIRDGCNTARGDYKKSHWLFNNSHDYYSGWFLGRSKCRALLRIDKDDNLIL